jgi:hypothetical protein
LEQIINLFPVKIGKIKMREEIKKIGGWKQNCSKETVLSEKNKKTRLEFAKKYKNWTIDG